MRALTKHDKHLKCFCNVFFSLSDHRMQALPFNKSVIYKSVFLHLKMLALYCTFTFYEEPIILSTVTNERTRK